MAFRVLLLAGMLAGIAAFAPPALGQDGATEEPGAGQPAAAATSDQPSQAAGGPSIADALPFRGDPTGLRAALAARGLTFSLQYIGEALGNPSGGVRRDAVYAGRLDAQVDVDLGRLAGWSGATLHGNLYQIQGRGLSGSALGNFLTVSGIEAVPATRLFELWLEQRVLDGAVSIRAGQLAADAEFLVSQYAGLFVNATFGWPTITAANLPNGGPVYPTATPGLRVNVEPVAGLTLMGAVFNGDPVGPNGRATPQRRDRSGFEFRTSDAPLLLVEAAYSTVDVPGIRLPGTLKVGGWRHLGRFDDARFAQDGSLLADPANTGPARRLSGNAGVYGVVDQLVYRVPGTEEGGIGAFARLSASPGDRNLVDFYVDGGLTFRGLVAGRPDDSFGLATGYARVASGARSRDRDARGFAATALATAGGPAPLPLVRSSEIVMEATYQVQVVPGWTVQPDLQYVVRPGARSTNPTDPRGGRIPDAVVGILRTTVRY